MESVSDLSRAKRISQAVVKKGIKLFLAGDAKLEKTTDSAIYFRVSSKNTHEVVMRLRPRKWSCDCTYFSLKVKPCSHIVSAMLLLEKRR